MTDSDIGLLRFGGLLNSIPENISKEIVFERINLTGIFHKNLASNILFEAF